MADILIRGMEMPKSCFDCIFENRFFGKIGCNNLPGMFANELHAIAYTTERNPFCPLISLPEGHGRLGDLDALMKNIGDVPYKGSVKRVLMSAPTIVPAEGGSEDCWTPEEEEE